MFKCSLQYFKMNLVLSSLDGEHKSKTKSQQGGVKKSKGHHHRATLKKNARRPLKLRPG
jgi:hypothetical protein